MKNLNEIVNALTKGQETARSMKGYKGFKVIIKKYDNDAFQVFTRGYGDGRELIGDIFINADGTFYVESLYKGDFEDVQINTVKELYDLMV